MIKNLEFSEVFRYAYNGTLDDYLAMDDNRKDIHNGGVRPMVTWTNGLRGADEKMAVLSLDVCDDGTPQFFVRTIIGNNHDSTEIFTDFNQAFEKVLDNVSRLISSEPVRACKYCKLEYDDHIGIDCGEVFLKHSATVITKRDNGEYIMSTNEGDEIEINYCPFCGRKLE